jgi:peptide/nickel transport system permease protein
VAAGAQTTLREHEARFEDLRRTLHRLRRSKLSLVGLGIVIGLILMALFAPYLAPYPEDVDSVHFERTFTPPGREFPFGTDEVGRDVLSRVIFGTRISLSLGVAVLAIALAIGVPLGLVAGYVGGAVNTVIMRLTDIFLSIPPLVLALAVSAMLTPTLENSIIAISFGWWPWYTRLIQGMVLSIKEETFIESSRSIGASPSYVIFKEILPNVVSILIVKVTLDIGYAILTGAVLGFLGLGVRPPTPEWGTMASKGRLHLPVRWWLTTFPGLAIFVTVLGFNLLGDGLRDAFDVELE